MKLIDKDKAVAEIEKLRETYNKYPTRNNYEDGLKEGRMIGYKDALYKIRSLEVKEVDLEKEIRTAYKSNRRYLGKYNMLVVINELQFTDITKHFFELGLKAQKGE